MSRTLHITRGLPGSGKTTLACAWVAERPLERARLNRDDLREQMFGKKARDAGRTGETKHELAVSGVQHTGVRVLLDAGFDVVIDDTNLNPAHVDLLRDIAAAAGANFQIWDLTGVPVDVCIARNEVRAALGERYVPENAIRELYDEWLAPKVAGAGGDQ